MPDQAQKQEVVDKLQAMLAETNTSKRRSLRRDLFKLMSEVPGFVETINGFPKRTFEETLSMWKSIGVDATLPKGVGRGYNTMVCVPHDDVPYCLDEHNIGDRGKMQHSIDHRALMIERHHAIIKEVYQFCTGLDVGDIWVLSGGGCQMQAFFGNRDGYLAILYLTMDNTEMGKSYDAQWEADDYKEFTLQVQGCKNDPLFKDMKIKGVKVRTCEEVYGPGY